MSRRLSVLGLVVVLFTQTGGNCNDTTNNNEIKEDFNFVLTWFDEVAPGAGRMTATGHEFDGRYEVEITDRDNPRSIIFQTFVTADNPVGGTVFIGSATIGLVTVYNEGRGVVSGGRVVTDTLDLTKPSDVLYLSFD